MPTPSVVSRSVTPTLADAPPSVTLVVPGALIATLALSLSVTSIVCEVLAEAFAVLVTLSACPAKVSVACSTLRSFTAVTAISAASPLMAPMPNTTPVAA